MPLLQPIQSDNVWDENIYLKNSTFASNLQYRKMESTRQKKVSRLIQKEMANLFLRKGNEIAPGKMISVTRVRISPDLSFAKIYISIFPSINQDSTLHSIEAQKAKIRFDLGLIVKSQLRIIPEIAFFIDDSLDYIDNIEKLLKS